MAARKPLKKSIRFEVFKRDSFTCQYCGAKAPDAILEVDHIIPVKDGGSDEIMNLVTSCRDCNRGKSCRELSDDTVVKKKQRQAEEVQERREMLQMMAQWHEELRDESEIYLMEIEKLINVYYPERELTAFGRRDILKKFQRFSYQEVYDAVQIALNQYDSLREALEKLGGICYNKRYRSD